MRDVVLIRCASPPTFDRVVERAVDLVRDECGSTAPPEIAVWTDRQSGLALIQSSAPDAPEKVDLHQNAREAFAYAGFVAQPGIASSDIRRLISLGRDGLPTMSRSPGGIATYFLADARRRRLVAWSSHAGMAGPYYTVGAACTAISNRPLLSHRVARQEERPVFSTRWAERVLLGGASLWDDTPFEGTLQPPPRCALVVEDDVRTAPHPVPLSGRYERQDPAGIEALCDASLAAVAPLRRWPRGELWLSGGKDSRLALALVRRAGIDIDIVTHARPGAGEGEAAAAVAQALGLETHITSAAGIAIGEDLLPAILANLRRSDGLLGEARQLAYPAAPHRGQPVVQGQAHHPRGGNKVRLTPDRDAVEQQLITATLGDHDLVEPALVDERRARLREILAGYPVQHTSELAYWLYADWRMTRWTTAAYAAAARSRMVLWPMMDERVLQITAALDPVDRAREVAFFSALCRLAPGLAGVPLYEDTWRFDSGRGGLAQFPDGHEERLSPFKEQGRGRTPDRRVPTIQPLFRQAVHDLGFAHELQRLVRPEVLRALCDEPDPAAALGRPHTQIVNFMWKATAVALVCEGTWLTASR